MKVDPQDQRIEGGLVSFRISFSGTTQAMPAGPPPGPPGTVQSFASGKCIELPGGQGRDGTAAIQYDCHGGPNQQWNIEPADAGYRIASRMSGKCIGTDPGHAAAGGHIVQSPCGRSLTSFGRSTYRQRIHLPEHGQPPVPGRAGRTRRQRR